MQKKGMGRKFLKVKSSYIKDFAGQIDDAYVLYMEFCDLLYELEGLSEEALKLVDVEKLHKNFENIASLGGVFLWDLIRNGQLEDYFFNDDIEEVEIDLEEDEIGDDFDGYDFIDDDSVYGIDMDSLMGRICDEVEEDSFYLNLYEGSLYINMQKRLQELFPEEEWCC